jgi:hypothetical protein
LQFAETMWVAAKNLRLLFFDYNTEKNSQLQGDVVLGRW